MKHLGASFSPSISKACTGALHKVEPSLTTVKISNIVSHSISILLPATLCAAADPDFCLERSCKITHGQERCMDIFIRLFMSLSCGCICHTVSFYSPLRFTTSCCIKLGHSGSAEQPWSATKDPLIEAALYMTMPPWMGLV